MKHQFVDEREKQTFRKKPNTTLRQARKERHWTQEHLADIIDVDERTIRRWEAGGYFPNPTQCIKLCQCFEKTLEELGFFKLEETHLSEGTSNLPFPLTRLIGREQELERLYALLQCSEGRLLTLVGTGGVGKTQLALKVTLELKHWFTDGVFFVSLASINNYELVIPTIAQALKVRAVGEQSLLEHLKIYLREKHLLLLLDNFEQVAEAATLVVELLEACPPLKVFITSRTALPVRGNYEFRVLPLALPDLKHLPEVKTLLQYPSIALFIECARRIDDTFQITSDNVRTIAEICNRLDGLPLVIELAVIQIKLYPLKVLLMRLEHRLSVLTSGAQDGPERQRTLRSTLRWSYDLLSIEEQRLFRHLSIFVGSCTLEAMDAVCGSGSGVSNILENVASLIGKCLLQRSKLTDSEVRLTMLETVREYGLECLKTSGEKEGVQRAHAQYYLALAEEIEPQLISAAQLHCIERLEQERENLREALRWLVEANEWGMALRLCGALWYFWFMHGYMSEWYGWSKTALAHSSEVAPLVRAKALYGTACLTYFQGDPLGAEVLCKESLKLYQEQGDEFGIAIVLNGLAHTALEKGDYDSVYMRCEESLPLIRKVGDCWRTAEALFLSAYGWYHRGEHTKAQHACEESLALFKRVGERYSTADVQQTLAYFVFMQGDSRKARLLYEESLVLSRELGSNRITAQALIGLGEVVAAQGHLAWAVQLWGNAEVLCESLNMTMSSLRRSSYERATYECKGAIVRTQLGEEAFAEAWDKGRTMMPEQILVALNSVYKTT